MALCFIAVCSNGTRDHIYGAYPTWQEAFECLKRSRVDDDDDAAKATTLEEFGYDARIVEVPDGGGELDIEIHEW